MNRLSLHSISTVDEYFHWLIHKSSQTMVVWWKKNMLVNNNRDHHNSEDVFPLDNFYIHLICKQQSYWNLALVFKKKLCYLLWIIKLLVLLQEEAGLNTNQGVSVWSLHVLPHGTPAFFQTPKIQTLGSLSIFAHTYSPSRLLLKIKHFLNFFFFVFSRSQPNTQYLSSPNSCYCHLLMGLTLRCSLSVLRVWPVDSVCQEFCWEVKCQLSYCCLYYRMWSVRWDWTPTVSNNPVCVCFADKYAEFDLNDEGEIGE